MKCLHGRMLHFHGRLVGDQPRADGANLLDFHKTVGRQGPAGIDQIHDAVREAHHGRKLHGPVQFDQFRLNAGRSKIAAA